MSRSHKKPIHGGKALEMRMQDVMDALYDSACTFAYRSTPDTLEILSIEPPKGDPFAMPRTKAKVHRMPVNRSTDIVDFLITREQQKLPLRA